MSQEEFSPGFLGIGDPNSQESDLPRGRQGSFFLHQGTNPNTLLIIKKKIAKDRKVIPDPIDDRKFQE